ALKRGAGIMSGENRNIDHRKLAIAILCGAIVVAGLATGSHWYRAAGIGTASARPISLASTDSAAHPSFVLAPNPLAWSPLAQQPLAISHPAKRTAALKSSTSELSSAPTSSLAISAMARARAMKTYAALPMMFEANNGQTDPR